MARRMQFLRNQAGATSPEYCILTALIIAACVVGIAILGARVFDLFWDSNVSMSDAFRR